MAAITLIPEAVRGTAHTTFTVPDGTVGVVTVKLISSVYPTDSTLNIDITVLQSFDNGTTFSPYFQINSCPGGLGGKPIGKNGSAFDGLPYQNVTFDGTGKLLDITITPSPGPFSWGVSGEIR